MREITVELTDYCPQNCNYCSSDCTTNRDEAIFIAQEDISKTLWKSGLKVDEFHKAWDVIHLSGGEPLAHPDFWDILIQCKMYAHRVMVHTNAISDIAFNPNVIDGVRVEAYLTVPDTTDKVHILKRVKQGREAKRPEVSFSSNYDGECGNCDHIVIRPNGSVAQAPCKKAQNA